MVAWQKIWEKQVLQLAWCYCVILLSWYYDTESVCLFHRYCAIVQLQEEDVV